MPQFSILIADDESVIRSGLLTAISWESWDAQVIATASDGLEALSLIQKLRPDLVIIDIKMPGIDGLEVIRRIKEQHIPTRFLILSGYDDFYLAQKAIRYGANGYFLKPLKIEEFKDELLHQFSNILSERSTSKAVDNLEDLMETSRIFFLNQLIMNEIRNREEIIRRQSQLKLHLKQRPCAVVVCTAAAPDNATLFSVLSSALPILSEALSGYFFEIWLHMQEHIVLLINQDSADELTAPLSRAIAALKKQTGFRFYAGIGKTIQELDQAADSYASALRALSYHIFCRVPDIYDNSVICRTEPPFSPSSISFEPLLSAIEVQDFTAIENYCNQFFQDLFFIPMPPPDFIRGMCLYLINNTRIRFLAKYPKSLPVSVSNPDEIMRFHSVEEMKNWLIRTISDYSRQYLNTVGNSDPIIQAAKQYIQKHINGNIKARDLACAVNLSESYFTIYFKTKTGQNFRDYVLNAKIEHAKMLLKQQKCNISEAAYATGYQDYRSFSRAFKNVTGMSPSDFQNLYAGNARTAKL